MFIPVVYKFYSTLISSAKIHAFSPAALWHSFWYCRQQLLFLLAFSFSKNYWAERLLLFPGFYYLLTLSFLSGYMLPELFY